MSQVRDEYGGLHVNGLYLWVCGGSFAWTSFNGIMDLKDTMQNKNNCYELTWGTLVKQCNISCWHMSLLPFHKSYLSLDPEQLLDTATVWKLNK